MKLINNYKGKVTLQYNKHVLKINALKNNTQKPQSLDYYWSRAYRRPDLCFGQTVWGNVSSRCLPIFNWLQKVPKWLRSNSLFPLLLSPLPHDCYQLHRADETKVIAKQQSEKHSTANAIKTNINWNHIKEGDNKNNKNNLETLYLTSQRTTAATKTKQ